MGLLKDDSALFDKVKEQALDPGANFLVGKATSAFTSANNVLGENLTTASNVNNIAGKGLEAPGKGLEAVNAGMNSAGLMLEVTQKGISYLTDEVVAYSAVVIKKLLELPIIERVSYCKEMTPKLIKSLGEIKAELETNEEELSENIDAEIEIHVENEKLKKIEKKVAEFKDKCDNFLKKCSDGLDTVVSYINAGPEWVDNKITKFATEKIEDLKKETAEHLIIDIEQKKKEARDQGWVDAQKIAGKINDEQKKAVKLALDLEKKIKKKAEHIAKAAIAQAKMLIKGLFGG